jgi:hypothetical protein
VLTDGYLRGQDDDGGEFPDIAQWADEFVVGLRLVALTWRG